MNPVVPSWGWYFFSTTPLLIISLLASKKVTGQYIGVFLPSVLALVIPLLLLLIDHFTQRQIFIVLSAGMYYFSLLGMYRLHHAREDKTAKSFLYAAAMAAIFFFYSGTYGFYLNFTFPLWGMMFLYFIGTSFISYETFVGVERVGKARMLLYSVILGFIMGEGAWVMSFWPFGYLTAGVIALLFFFLLWDIALDGLREKLSLRKTVWRFFFFLVLLTLLLLSTPWRILV